MRASSNADTVGPSEIMAVHGGGAGDAPLLIGCADFLAFQVYILSPPM